MTPDRTTTPEPTYGTHLNRRQMKKEDCGKPKKKDRKEKNWGLEKY